MSDMINPVARAICKHDGAGWDSALMRSLYRSHAHAAIEAHKAALAEAGYVIVPREPTEAMLIAGCDCMGDAYGEGGHPASIWPAMIDAARAPAHHGGE